MWVDWRDAVIHVQKADMPVLRADPELRKLDLRWFHQELRTLEASEGGIWAPRTHDHNRELVISGDVYARAINILEPYVVEFENGQYAVKCVGANHNIADRLVQNNVSLIIGNSAGLIRLSDEELAEALAGAVWSDTVSYGPETKGGHVQRLDVEVSSRARPGDGLTDEQATQLLEMYLLKGLDREFPLLVNPNSRSAGPIAQDIVKIGSLVVVKRR